MNTALRNIIFYICLLACLPTFVLSQPGTVAPGNSAKSKKTENAKQYIGRLISLDLQYTDLSNALRILEEVSNTKFIGSEQLDQGKKINLRLIDVPWDQALDTLLETVGATSLRNGEEIRIVVP